MLIARHLTVRTLLFLLLFLVVCRPAASCSGNDRTHRTALHVSVYHPCGL